MTLRLQIQLIVAALTLAFVATLAALQVIAMREAVREEVVAANRVAEQLLRRVAWVYAESLRDGRGAAATVGFLEALGRVRANDISFTARDGTVLYRSPPSPYKAGRDAPAWFARLIAPDPFAQKVDFPDGQLDIRANASRAVLDAWDTLAAFAGMALALLVVVNALVFWAVGRATRPFARITEALQTLQAGRFDVQLPPLPGHEAGAIGSAFNRMVAVLQDNLKQTRQLHDQRALARHVHERLEDERRAIAHALHDELGQSVTGMRSIARSISQRAGDAQVQDGARLIETECARLYEAMHALVPRISPVVLERLGLADALQELAERTRQAHQSLRVDLSVALGEAALPDDIAMTLYRAAQEGLTNALRHGQATALRLSLGTTPGSVRLELEDNGRGLAEGSAESDGHDGHYGLRWLRERVEGLGGQLTIANRTTGGVGLRVDLPLHDPDTSPTS
jgi:two-component system, NarL family, sensor histidine kinase UhpB